VPTFGGLAGRLSKHDGAIRELLADGYRQMAVVDPRGLDQEEEKPTAGQGGRSNGTFARPGECP